MRKGLDGEEEKGGEVWGKKFVLARVAREKEHVRWLRIGRWVAETGEWWLRRKLGLIMDMGGGGLRTEMGS